MPLVDTHVHAFAAGLAMAPARRYTPATAAPLDDLLSVLDAAGVARALLVQPSFLADDHAYLLECLARHPDRLRGVASLLDPGVALAHYGAWHDAGVRGVRLNLAGLPTPDLSRWRDLARVMAELGWHLEVHATGEQWADLRPGLERWPGTVVLDHLGRAADPLAQSHVVALARLDHVWVKASAPYRTPDGWAADTAARILDATGGRRVLWGSDWPFTQHEGATSYPDLVEWAVDVLGPAADLVDGNAARLLGWT
ncbi:amidohydrolase family protein [Pseudonocardia sp. DSM 110487]|uniref:amidohydrolase family protein n=1 Tax=Pseudonocardia sp. DSM 110487 TaxID=2865833 RepID=UPI001C69D796|nr:amidohydrolase family protein [Pseudonocardia sp. DSM 110487]QYN37057.1 amidohydrolase family protein [Pseudonocardia sp. DSM 110487]